MSNFLRAFSVLAGALLLAGCATPPADAPSLIRQAEAALGSEGLNTLVVSGRGSGGTFGQAYQPGNPWPALNVSVLSRSFNFETGAFREEFARSRAEPTGGGAVPLMGQGEARSIGFLRDGLAWAPAAQGGASPEPRFVWGRQHDLWTGTPHGALKAAARFGAVAGTREHQGQRYRTLSFTAPGQVSATVFIDAQGLVTRIESVMPHAVTGDTAVATEFSDYRAFGPIRYPARMRQSQGPFEVLDVQATEVQANAPVDIGVPDSVRSARETVNTTAVAPGVWYLTGGSHHSVAIELAQQIVLVEAPLFDGRTLPVIAAANQLAAGKTVKTVINSHHHYDHAGGLRAAAGEGVVLITSAAAKPYFERVFANPNRLAPDRLAQSGQTPRILGVDDRLRLADPVRPIEIYEMQGSVHARGFLMVWLPQERILIQADAYTPGAPGAAPPPVPNANHLNLVQNIEQRGPPVERILALHGRMAPMSELLAQVGRK